MIRETALVGMNNMNIEEPEKKLEEAMLLLTTHSVDEIPKVDQSTIPAAELLEEELTTLSADQPQEVELSSVAETAFVGMSNMNTEAPEKLEEAMVTTLSLDQIPDVEQSTIPAAEILEEELTTHSVDQISDVEQSTIAEAEIVEEELTTQSVDQISDVEQSTIAEAEIVEEELITHSVDQISDVEQSVAAEIVEEEELTTLSADQPQDVEESTVVETMKAKLGNFWERIIMEEGIPLAGFDMSYYLISYVFKVFITLLSSDKMHLSLFKAVIYTNALEGAEAALGIPFAWFSPQFGGILEINLLCASASGVWGLVIAFDDTWNQVVKMGGLLLMFSGQFFFTHYNNTSCYKKHLTIEVKVNPNQKGERAEEQGGNSQQEHHNREVEQSLKRERRLRFPCASLFRIKCYNIQLHNYMNIPWLFIAVFAFRHQYYQLFHFVIFGSLMMFGVRMWRVYRSKNPTGSFITFLLKHYQDPKPARNSRLSRWRKVIAWYFTNRHGKYIVQQVDDKKGRWVSSICFSLVLLMYGIMAAAAGSFFVEQVDKSNRFHVPTPLFILASDFVRRIVRFLCNWILAKKVNAPAPHKRFYSTLRVGLGILLSVPCFAIASVVRAKTGNAKHISVLLLFPQLCLIGVMNGLVVDGICYYYKELPSSFCRSYASIIAEGIVGMGKILSIVWFCFWYYITNTNNKHAPGWFGGNIGESTRLDYYYKVMAGLGIITFITFVSFAFAFRRRLSSQVIPDEHDYRACNAVELLDKTTIEQVTVFDINFSV